jgi:hypothetical protein
MKKSKKLNFAAQPEGGGMINVISVNTSTFDDKEKLWSVGNLTTDVPNIDSVFLKRPLFADNCNTKNFTSMKNFDNYSTSTTTQTTTQKSFWSGLLQGAVDTTKYGVDLWSRQQELSAAQAQAEAAVAIERAKQAQAQADAQAAMAQSNSVTGKIKAYALPIAITGIVIIGGIAAYFYYKKKA